MVWCPLDPRSSNRPRMGSSAAPGHPSGQQDLAPRPPRLPHLRSELRGCGSQRQRRPTSAPRSPRRCGVSLVTSANVPQIGAWECRVSGRSGPDSACFCGVTVVTVMRFPGLRRDGEPSTPERALLLALSSLSQGHFARPAGIMLFTRYVFGNNLVFFFCSAFRTAYLTRARTAIVFVWGPRWVLWPVLCTLTDHTAVRAASGFLSQIHTSLAASS